MSNSSNLTTSSAMMEQIESAALALVNILGLASNALVFLLFYRKPTLRTFSNGFVLGLSICHMVQTVIQMPYVVLPGVLGQWIFGEVWCKISASLSICFSLATAFSLLLIAMDRNYAVNSPLHYTIITTKKTILLQIAGIWAVALIISSPPVFGFFRVEYRHSWNTCAVAWYEGTPSVVVYSTLLCLCGFLFPLIKLTISYRSMYMAARKNGSTALIYAYRRRMDEWRAIRTPLLVVSSHILSCLPLYLVVAVESYTGIQVQKSWLMTAVSIALFSSSFINPYLYVFRNKASRKELRKIFRQKKFVLKSTRISTDVHRRCKRFKEDVVSNSSEETFPASTGDFKAASFDNPTVGSWDSDRKICCISASETNLSKYGQAKRNCFVLTRLGNSSDTTLTSTSSDSQDLSLQAVCVTKPRLIRQHSAVISYSDHTCNFTFKL